MRQIAVIAGDGIGKEVIPAGIRVLSSVCDLEFHELGWGSDLYLRTGAMMPEDGLHVLEDFDAIYLGAVGVPEVPDHVTLWGLLLPIRKALELSVNVRPVNLLRGVRGPLAGRGPADIDMLFIRENTERTVRYAFDRARERSGSLTSVTKSNASRYTYVLWDEVVEDVHQEYADVVMDRVLVDAMAARMVLRPDA